MRQILFIAWHDTKFQLRQGSTLLWLLVMPPIFFYFIGTVTGGFASSMGGGQATPVTVVAESLRSSRPKRSSSGTPRINCMTIK